MTKKKTAKNISPDQVKMCKQLDCSATAQVKGFCRLHFLKVVAGKGEGDGEPQGKLSVAGIDRRKSNRLQSLEPLQVDDEPSLDRATSLGELDLDVDLDLDFDKTGS